LSFSVPYSRSATSETKRTPHTLLTSGLIDELKGGAPNNVDRRSLAPHTVNQYAQPARGQRAGERRSHRGLADTAFASDEQETPWRKSGHRKGLAVCLAQPQTSNRGPWPA